MSRAYSMMITKNIVGSPIGHMVVTWQSSSKFQFSLALHLSRVFVYRNKAPFPTVMQRERSAISLVVTAHVVKKLYICFVSSILQQYTYCFSSNLLETKRGGKYLEI